MSDNPFALDYVEPEQTSIDLQEQEREAEAVNDGPLITKPGAYPYISAEDYHRNPALLPGPSLSSSGAKTLGTMSPFHFWFDSPLNPNRPPEPDKPHFRVGKAAHDIILLNERWEQFYHVLPEGFSRAKKNQMRDAIEEADAAIEEGKTVLRYEESLTVVAIAEALKKNKLAVACLTNDRYLASRPARLPPEQHHREARRHGRARSQVRGADACQPRRLLQGDLQFRLSPKRGLVLRRHPCRLRPSSDTLAAHRHREAGDGGCGCGLPAYGVALRIAG
mgnify:CR=1 FL=1